MDSDQPDAEAAATTEGETLVVRVGGRWRLTRPAPAWAELAGGRAPRAVRIEAAGLAGWDSALVLFLAEAERWCAARQIGLATAGLPEVARAQAAEAARAAGPAERHDHRHGFFTAVGLAAREATWQARAFVRFIGACMLSLMGLARRPRKFRWKDCLLEMQQCGAMALPIVGLISLLVGLILAYQAAVQLRQYGGDIFVADLVGLAIVREMGPMMAAVVLAGRTGAAFAAQIANMKANEEIDALQVLGVSPVDFLVLPRMVALALMMPLLALYADCLGILGGMAVSLGLLNIPPTAYWVETMSVIDLSDLGSGLIKAAVFGVLIGLAGCLRGLQAERSAAGVGRAATSAVVTGILLIIVADAVFAVIFNVVGF